MKMRAALASLLATLCAAQFQLKLLEVATYPMARCLDGSQGGFYIAPGTGGNASKWLVHTQGGGWCNSDADCLSRSRTPLGSSSTWGPMGCPNGAAPPCYADGGSNGMLSNSSAINPELFGWTKVFM